MPYKKILVALEVKDAEKKVVEEALKLSTALHSSLSFIHINDPGAGKMHMMMDTLKRVNKNDLQNFVSQLGVPQDVINSCIVLDSSNYPKAIAEATNGFDLLIIGHQKRNSFLAALTDSTDERVLNLVNCPILLVTM